MGKVVVPDFETVSVPVEEAWKSGKDKKHKSEESFEKQEQSDQVSSFEEKIHMDVVSRPGMDVVTPGMDVVTPKMDIENDSHLEKSTEDRLKKRLDQINHLEFSDDIMEKMEQVDAIGQELKEKPIVKEKLSRRRKKEIKRQNELKERREQQRAELDKLNNQLAKEAEERRALEKEEQRKLDLEMEQRLLMYRSQYIQGMKREEDKITKSGDDLKMARLQELEKKRALEEKQKQRRQQQRMRMESEFEKYHIEDRGSNIIGFKQKRKK